MSAIGKINTRPKSVAGWLLRVHERLVRSAWPYQTVFLIVKSESQCIRLAGMNASFVRILWFYFLPMMLTLAVLEGWGLKRWARLYEASGASRPVTGVEVIGLEAMRILMTLAAMIVCAHLIKMFAETFRGRNTYRQTLTVVIYCFAPVCLARALLVFYPFNNWIIWAFGIVFALKILYHVLPRVLDPDPPHALGLFFSSALFVLLVTLLERFITLWWLGKALQPVSPI